MNTERGSKRRQVQSSIELARTQSISAYIRTGPGHAVSSMVEFGVAILVLLSAGIFLAHAVGAYRSE